MQPTLHTLHPAIQRSLTSYTANGHTFHLVKVQKGGFMMGDDQSEYSYEKPAHRVDIIADFELGQYPVTQALWEAVMGANPSRFKGADRPVEQVSWDDIRGEDGFLARLNALPEIAARNAADGRQFRLPSEAEWEYAARGGRYARTFPWEYAGSNHLAEVGWYGDNSQQQTQPVGRKQPNALGLYDMSGNVWEWCEDVWQDNYHNTPRDGSANVDGKSGVRVLRGGSWNYFIRYSRVADRFWFNSFDRGINFGLRLARD